MSTRELKVFESFFLKPIQLIYVALFIYYLFTAVWWLSGFFALMFFYNGWIGGAIVNRGKTFSELAQGTAPESLAAVPKGSSYLQYWEFGKAIVHLRYVMWLTLLALGFHYDFQWYIVIPVAILIGLILSFVIQFATIFISARFQ